VQDLIGRKLALESCFPSQFLAFTFFELKLQFLYFFVISCLLFWNLNEFLVIKFVQRYYRPILFVYLNYILHLKINLLLWKTVIKPHTNHKSDLTPKPTQVPLLPNCTHIRLYQTLIEHVNTILGVPIACADYFTNPS
jgi:hypothetical protein